MTTYPALFPLLFGAFVLSLLITPWVGKLAERIGALDMPSFLRQRQAGSVSEQDHRINHKVTARLGGLAMVISMVLVLLVDSRVSLSWGIWAGMIVLTIFGIADDVYDLPPRTQFLAQILAAFLVIVSGIRIEGIQIAGISINLMSSPVLFTLFGHAFVLAADLVTMIWIVALINFINWIGGIDALNGSVSAVAAGALLLIAMRSGEFGFAMLIATYLGAVLGVLPYNYYPSKIFYGFGESINGFLLAIFAISVGGKFAASIIVLGLPLLDAIWVALLRMKTKWAETKNIFKLLAATMHSDRNHLHHRLLDVGYSWKAVLFIELAMMFTLATVALYFSGFSNDAIELMIALTGLLSIFAVVGVARRKIQRGREYDEKVARRKPKVVVRVVGQESTENPEDRYAY